MGIKVGKGKDSEDGEASEVYDEDNVPELAQASEIDWR
jgi:hypothetical protein